MEGSLKIVSVTSKWHSPCDTTPGIPPLPQSMMTARYVHARRLPFPNELERLIRYDKWISREALQENLESILFVSELHMYTHFYLLRFQQYCRENTLIWRVSLLKVNGPTSLRN